MRNLMKLIAVTAITALLVFVLATCATADDKIYTSPVFKLPPERLQLAGEIIENQENEGEPEESDGPEADTGDESEDEPDGDEGLEELDEDDGSVTDEPAEEKRRVIIKSSHQGAIVTEGDQITMTSELRGFRDDESVEYQWQVDRGDGLGWVDVNGANRFKYTFVANEETIKYSWRLIVNVIDE